MGTTLQAPPFELGLDSALWSSELLASDDGRAQLERLHKTWLEAGADIVETCTYQSSLPLFLPASPSPADQSTALTTMNSALPLAVSCCSSRASSSSRKPSAALSLGPYGAALQPGQEYSGAYPPPFGSVETAAKDAKPACSQEALDLVHLPLDEVRAGLASTASDVEVHLAAWHLQRLQHFSQSPVFDEGIPLLAFETVPSLTEILAIRRAMHVFSNSSSRSHAPNKTFYISLVFPRVNEGTPAETVRFPDPSLAHLPSLADQVPLLVHAALDPREGYATPAGLGFNCTSPLHASFVVEALSAAVASSALTATSQTKPWLVFYPDGGAIYDVQTRTWHHPAGLTDDAWALLVADAVQVGREAGDGTVWGGVVVGGCCKAGPGAIRALRKEVERRGWAREQRWLGGARGMKRARK
ncbi:AdoMet-homocysteine methyltransferase [Rhodotorula toruloides]